MKKHGFILALIGVVLLAFLFPQLGARDGILRAGLLSKLGVMVIFLLQGLTLKTRELASGLRDLRLHAFVQGWIFLLAAAVLVATAMLLRALEMPDLANGFLYLALVPTTISSAVAFTSAAGGNVPAAIFNVTLANVFGVIWVPAGCLFLFATSGQLESELVLGLLWKVARLILIPLIAGQLLRPMVWQKRAFTSIAPYFKLINHGIILFIVFAAFSQSLLTDSWNGIAPGSIVLLIGLTMSAVIIVHAGTWFSSGWLTRSRPDRITALYCGSQRTLAAGAPMAVAIFSDNGQFSQVNLGLLLLPLLVYHPLQLLLAAFLVPGFNRAR